jgi:hypothetical protein
VHFPEMKPRCQKAKLRGAIHALEDITTYLSSDAGGTSILLSALTHACASLLEAQEAPVNAEDVLESVFEGAHHLSLRTPFSNCSRLVP